MSPVKEEAIKLIQSLPEDCTVEDIQYHLEVRRRVERGLQAIDEGRVVSQEEAERRVAEWIESSGPNPR
jgi:predicted transcriptional regulator